ncbi:MAG: N-acetylneuraminate synthase family protein, partial [Tepidisphaeraceae bacterium]
MNIAKRTISAGSPVFVIAEIGVNHDGSVATALRLVNEAADAGADAVKLQVFGAERLMHRSAIFADYQQSRVDAESPVEMLRQYELSAADLQQIARACRDRNLAVIATPFSPDDVPVVAVFADAIKIASPDLVNRVLLRRAAATGLPLIVSTGASSQEEIVAAHAWLQQQRADFALLHCISSYPTLPQDAQLSWIGALSRLNVPIVYSDHTTDALAGPLAVAAGACVIEKHLTYDTTASGPDHSASFDGPQFAAYTAQIRRAEQMMGRPGARRVLDVERDVRNVSRQSLVAVRPLSAGHVITADDLTTQRPGTGI